MIIIAGALWVDAEQRDAYLARDAAVPTRAVRSAKRRRRRPAERVGATLISTRNPHSQQGLW